MAQTENSFFEEKVILRISELPKKSQITVLDAFSNEGRIWKEIKRRTGLEILVTRIEKKVGMGGLYLQGDNLKFLSSLNLNSFDIIDLDAYGTPINQMIEVFKQDYRGVIFGTFIQTMFGGLPYKMLEDLGYSRKMIKKCRSIFNRNGVHKFKEWLALNKIKKIKYLLKSNKLYFIVKP